jgi:hypothetical protein
MKDNKLPRGVTHSLLAAVMQAMKHDSSMSKVISSKVKAKATPKTDPIGKEDKDINNDGKVNNTDGFLAARRRAIAARVAKLKGNKNTNTSPKVAIKGKKDSVDVKPALGESMTSEQYDSEVQWALRSGLTPPIRPAMFAEAVDPADRTNKDREDTVAKTKKAFPNVKHFTAKGNPDWEKHGYPNIRSEEVYTEAHLAMPLKGHDYHTKTDAELRYIRKDAGEAARLQKGMSSEPKYLDQVNDAETVLHYRSKGGQKVTKQNEAHTQCGTPDCCGQCDTTQVNEAAMSDDAHELMIHGDNNSQLYKSSYVPVAKNLEKKWKKGTYDHEKAKKLWKYHADRASESYKKEHGHMFSPAVRREAAGHYADHHKAEMEAGNMHESLSEAMAMRRRVNQERADSGDDNVLNQLRKIRPTSSKTIRWADGSKSDITLAHRDAALAKHAEVMGGRGPGSYGPDKQAFLKMLGSNEKGFHGALAGKHTKRSTIAGFKVRRKGVDEALRGDQHKIDVAEPKGKITSADFKKIRMKKEEVVVEGDKHKQKGAVDQFFNDYEANKAERKAKRIHKYDSDNRPAGAHRGKWSRSMMRGHHGKSKVTAKEVEQVDEVITAEAHIDPDYKTAAAKQDQMMAHSKVLNKALAAVPGHASGPMGLTPDHIRATPEWKKAKSALDKHFAELQNYNKAFVKMHRGKKSLV